MGKEESPESPVSRLMLAIAGKQFLWVRKKGKEPEKEAEREMKGWEKKTPGSVESSRLRRETLSRMRKWPAVLNVALRSRK